jgi:hypothetical protein
VLGKPRQHGAGALGAVARARQRAQHPRQHREVRGGSVVAVPGSGRALDEREGVVGDRGRRLGLGDERCQVDVPTAARDAGGGAVARADDADGRHPTVEAHPVGGRGVVGEADVGLVGLLHDGDARAAGG